MRSGLCCPGFRASIMRTPCAPEHEMAARGGAERGDHEQRPLPTPYRARRPAPSRRRTARRAFPRSLRRAPGHKGLEGKHGARPALSERLVVRSGLERTPRLEPGSPEQRARAPGGALCGALSLPLALPQPSLRPRQPRWGRAGAQRAGAELPASAGRSGRLHFPSRAVMAELGASLPVGRGDSPRGKPEAFSLQNSFLRLHALPRELVVYVTLHSLECDVKKKKQIPPQITIV